jgi:hypothetical protein
MILLRNVVMGGRRERQIVGGGGGKTLRQKAYGGVAKTKGSSCREGTTEPHGNEQQDWQIHCR